MVNVNTKIEKAITNLRKTILELQDLSHENLSVSTQRHITSLYNEMIASTNALEKHIDTEGC